MPIERPHDLLAKAIDLARPGERNQIDGASLSRLEAHGSAGSDVEPEPEGRGAVERQRRIGLGEVVVRPDLDRAVAGVGDRDRQHLAADVQIDVAIAGQDLSRYQGCHRGSHLVSCPFPTGPRRRAVQVYPAARTLRVRAGAGTACCG